jgi:ABC-2 type transport system ATP-binding protein
VKAAVQGMPPQPAIDVQHLEKRFGEVHAVRDISFQVVPGQCMGLLGGNGAGKTTTLAMLLGLVIPTGGQIAILGEPIPRRRYEVLGRMNFSSPYVDFPTRLTVAEILTVYGQLYGIRNPGTRIGELAGLLDLETLLKKRYGQLSAGQKARCGLAKALLNRPQVLILDEPTASMDPDTADRLRRYLLQYLAESHAAMVLASHNMQEVERLCDEVLIMDRGRVAERGTPEALMEHHSTDMEGVFLSIARSTA